jgi:hypothetical protein
MTFRKCGVDDPAFATAAFMVAEPGGNGEWHPQGADQADPAQQPAGQPDGRSNALVTGHR